MKVCSKCKNSRPLHFFHADKNGRDGKQRWCTECTTQYAKSHYQKNTEYYSTKNEKLKKKRVAHKKKMIQYKGGRCQGCGYDKCLQALAFHHIDSTEKDFRLSGGVFTRSWDSTTRELDKCVLVCHNCHSEIHAGLRTLNQLVS